MADWKKHVRLVLAAIFGFAVMAEGVYTAQMRSSGETGYVGAMIFGLVLCFVGARIVYSQVRYERKQVVTSCNARPVQKYTGVASLAIGIAGLLISCGLVSTITKSELEKICREEGGLKIKGTLTVDGYFHSGSISDRFGYHDVSAKLIKERFAFIESEQKYRTHTKTGKRYLYDYDPLHKHAVGNGTKYYRYYLAPAGSAACAGYEVAIKSSPFELPSLRQMGLPSSLCIASEKVDSVKSEYELVSKRETTTNPIPIRWARYQVRNINNGEVKAQYSSFTHCFGKSVIDSGGNIRCIDNAETYVCHNPKEYLAFLESAFKSAPNTVLPENPQLVVTNQSGPVPVQRLTATMTAQLPKREGYVPEQVYWNLTHPVDKDGALSIEHNKLVILKDGILRKIPIMAEGRPLQLPWALRGADDGVWVMSGNLMPGLGLHQGERDWWILKYSWEGQQIAAHALAMPQFPLKGDAMFRLDNFEVGASRFSVAVLDFSDAGNGFNIDRAYRLDIHNSSIKTN